MDYLKGILWAIVGVVTLGLLCLSVLQIMNILPYFFGENVMEYSAFLIGQLTGSIVMSIIMIWCSRKAWRNAFKWCHHEGKSGSEYDTLIKH